MKKFFSILLGILLCLFFGYWILKGTVTDTLNGIPFNAHLPDVETVALPVTKPAINLEPLLRTEKKHELPPPLRSVLKPARTPLTVLGALTATNRERSKAKLPRFTSSPLLQRAAEMKVADMFARQYFDHNAPDGTGIGELMGTVGYAYIRIGENLALGVYENDADLVRAWMASPGHRENILNPAFTEIGIAVQKGNFQGKTLWLAVQEFGKPLSACPQASEILREHIHTAEQEVTTLESELKTREQELKSMSPNPHSETEVNAYNEKVNRYNALIDQYQTLAKTIQTWAAAYTAEVNAFNACAE